MLLINKQVEKLNPSITEIYGTDLTALAHKGKLNSCFGREQELLELMEILIRKNKNNPILIGEAGIGKKAIIELFANRIINNLVPFILQGRTIISLDLRRLITGTQIKKGFEVRFEKFFNEILKKSNIILFIDEIHLITETVTTEKSLNFLNLFKSLLTRTGLQLIGATTPTSYSSITQDSTLNRQFQPIYIKESSIKDTIHLLYNLRPNLETFHNIEIEPKAIKLAVELSDRYICDRFLPEKAIDILDIASAKHVIKITNLSEKSVINSIINGGLINIGILKLEAFRRGDIAVEFIFQEIENAYRNFLLKWLESPLTIPLKNKANLTPLSKFFFTKMRISVLNKIDDLLFLSKKPRSFINKFKIKILSKNKNKIIYNELNFNILKNNILKLSLYRISLFLFIKWLNIKNKKFLINNLNYIFKVYKIYKYICTFRKKFNKLYILLLKKTDFFNFDIENYEEKSEFLSELEEKKLEIFNDYLIKLKPVLNKGIIESLKSSSKINISNSELILIYNLLGYFSLNQQNTFLSTIINPKLITIAKKRNNLSLLKNKITEKEIRELVSKLVEIPLQSLSSLESQHLLNLELILHKRVIGQEEAITALSKAIRRARLGVQVPNRPIASFLFCGPTGVGKTEITKALAEIMFGSEKEMIRFDMSEFMEKFTISRLIGSPPGYIGYDDGGQLTNAVRLKPYAIILFDEIEKAHPDILNILLQVLEDGLLTDNKKRIIKFDNSIIILTSNVGAEEIQYIIKKEHEDRKIESEKSILKNLTNKNNTIYEDNYTGIIKFLKSSILENFLLDIKHKLKLEFTKSFYNLKEYNFLEKEIITKKINLKQIKKPNEISNYLKDTVLEALTKLFLPEFLNRLDDIIIFLPLKIEELRKICDIMLNNLIKRLKTKKIILTINENVKIKLSNEGYNPLFGARPLRRLITKNIEDLISENLLKSTKKKERKIKIILNNNKQIVII